MRILRKTGDLTDFFEGFARAAARILMLDYDGTLAPFHVRPERALPHAGVRELLDDIMTAERSRVVFVSGRPIQDLLPLLNLQSRPDLWGAHGGSFRITRYSGGCLDTTTQWPHPNPRALARRMQGRILNAHTSKQIAPRRSLRQRAGFGGSELAYPWLEKARISRPSGARRSPRNTLQSALAIQRARPDSCVRAGR